MCEIGMVIWLLRDQSLSIPCASKTAFPSEMVISTNGAALRFRREKYEFSDNTAP